MAKIKSRKKIDASQERKIILGMIISDSFLKKIQDIYNPNLIKAAHINIIAGWCIDYWDDYEKAPGRHIQDIFEECVNNDELEPENEDLIADFLESISEEHERKDLFNVDYILKKAEEHLNKKSIQQLIVDMKNKLADNFVDEAEDLLRNYKKVQLPQSMGINPFNDEEAIREAFEQQAKNLFELPGELGRYLDGVFTRDSFVAFLAPEKRGKTWELWELAIRAAGQRCNVAFFDVGDMSRAQSIRRAHIKLAKKSNMKKFSGNVLTPVLDCKKNQFDTCEYKQRACFASIVMDEKEQTLLPFEEAPDDYMPCTFCRKKSRKRWEPATWFENVHVGGVLGWKEAVKKGKKFMKRMSGKNFKLVNLPNSSANIYDITNQLDTWEEQEGFVADVIFIDMFDILAPEPNSGKDPRHQINATWKAGRRLSQEKNCSVVTVTQAAKTGYKKNSLEMEDTSEDKRKMSHVTAMLGLNQTEDEKEKGILRIGKIVMREDEFHIKRQVTIIQCLKRGMPYIDSF